MKRSSAPVALGVLILFAAPLTGDAGSTDVPLPWPTLVDAARTVTGSRSGA